MSGKRKASPPPAGRVKRKRVVLTISQKLEICDLLASGGHSYGAIAERYGIGRQTVADIKNKEKELREFQRKSVEMNMSGSKSMKTGQFDKLDEALYVWFKQKRGKNMDISGDLLMEQADMFFKKLYPGETCSLSFSHGFLWRFCQRHQIRSVTEHGEKLSANAPAAEDFVSSFPGLIEDYSHHQIFNCDETGLNFRKLPGKTLISSFEGRAEGRKKSKDRVTLNACANVTGSIKLPLLLIGKSARPRCFRGVNTSDISVTYRHQKNAWVDSQLFLDWFQNVFTPFVQEKLIAMNLEPKAILLLDNCPAHPDANLLVSADKKVTALYLPPNVTSLIQPMDQGILEMLKRKYRKSIVRDLLQTEDEDVVKFLKAINMLTIAEKVGTAWDDIPPISIRRSWRKILPMEEEADDTAGGSGGDDDGAEEASQGGLVEDLRLLDQDVSVAEVESLEADDGPGYEHLGDDAIIDLVERDSHTVEISDDEEEEEEVVEPSPVSHGEALEAFQTCISWLRHQPESSACNLATLSSLRDIAASKRVAGLRQAKISSFFKP